METQRKTSPVELRRRAILALVITAVAWSTSGILIKLVDWNAMAIAGVRSLISGTVLLLYLRRPRITWHLDQISAAVAYAATMFTFVAANKLTTSANAIFLQYLSPVFVALLGIWLLGERPRRSEWIIIGVVIAGMGLFFVDRLTLSGMEGNLIAILSGVCFAAFIVLMRRQHTGSPLESMMLGHFLAAVVSIPFWFRSGGPDTTGWIALLLLGVFQVGLSSVLFSFAVKHVTALGGAIILTMITLRSILGVRYARQGSKNPGASVSPPSTPAVRARPRTRRNRALP